MIGKLLVFLAFVAGGVGFVLPFIAAAAPEGTIEVSVSAMQLIQGVEGVQAAMAETVAGAADAAVAEKIGRSFGQMADQVRAFVAIVFAPTVLFLLIGLLGLRRFGRGLGAAALIVGGLTLAGWFIVTSAATEHSAGASATQVGFGLGFTLVLVGGVLGIVGGLAGLIAPQQRAEASS